MVPALPLRSVLNSLPDQASPSSRQSRRTWLHDSTHVHPFFLQSTPAMGFGSVDMMASLAYTGTPTPDQRRTQSKVALPLLLDECAVGTDRSPTAVTERDMAAKAAASSLVLRSVAFLLRSARDSSARMASHGGGKAGVSTNETHGDPAKQAMCSRCISFSRSERRKSALDVLLSAAGFSTSGSCGASDRALMQMLTRRVDQRSQRDCALIALLHTVSDLQAAHPAAVPAAADAAAALAVRLLCTTNEVGQSSAAEVDTLRHVLLCGLSRLSERALEPLPPVTSWISSPRMPPDCPPPTCEHWNLTSSAADAAPPLFRLPLALARRVVALAAETDETCSRAELVALLHLIALLLNHDVPLAAHTAAITASLAPLEVTAAAVSATAGGTSWDASLVALTHALLAALTAAMSSPCVPAAAGQRFIALVVLHATFLETVFDYMRAVLLDGMHLHGDAASVRALRLQTLDFFAAYAGLVHRQPSARGGGGSEYAPNGGGSGLGAHARMLSQDLGALLTTTNIAAPAPPTPPLTPIGLQQGADDVLLDSSAESGGGGDLSIFDTSSMTEGGLRTRRALTRSQAIQVRGTLRPCCFYQLLQYPS